MTNPTPATGPQTSGQGMTNLEIIQAFYDASARGDLDGMLAVLAPDCAWTEMAGFPYAGTYHGPDQVRQGVFARLRADWSAFSVTVDELLDAGDTIVAVGSYHGTHRRTGRTMTARTIHLWRLRGGKVTSFEQFTDTVQATQAATP